MGYTLRCVDNDRELDQLRALMESPKTTDVTLADILARPAWMDAAACRGQTDLFFPERGQSTAPARALCAACPVVEECGDYAAQQSLRLHGIWGGVSQRGRKLDRRAAAVEERRAA